MKEFPKSQAGVRTAVLPKSYVWVLKKLRAYNPFGEFIFYENGKRLHTTSIRSRMYRECEKARVVRKSPHKARRTYASILLDNSIDNRLITDVVGHTDIACTEGYYHKNRRSIERKVEIISSLPEFMAN